MNVEIECVTRQLQRDASFKVIWTMSTESGPHSYIADIFEI